MTPSARYAASISILDKIIAGAPAERELTIWARGNRFAGSKDRAAIRDLVYDSLRNLRSYKHFSGLSGARGVFVGRLISKNEEIESIFNGQGYGPVCLTDIEKNTVNTKKNDMPYAVQMDIPDWLSEKFGNIHNYNILKSRAPIDLRVNIKKISLKSAISELKKDNIETEKLNLVDTALRVKGETRKIPQTKLYLNGLIELQDAGSQALVAQLDCPKNGKVLDYCAGGGGKTLAIASRTFNNVSFSAYDKNQSRLKELKIRAQRAGIKVDLLKNDPVIGIEKYDLVVVDVPCSGSGSWRRSPDAKWKFTEQRLIELMAIQTEILENTADLVATGGTLAYLTCSLFSCENEEQVNKFILKNKSWKINQSKQIKLSSSSDGFYLASLSRR
jgi:16S rRNA (cytosine967-C5)-methyltransferase